MIPWAGHVYDQLLESYVIWLEPISHLLQHVGRLSFLLLAMVVRYNNMEVGQPTSPDYRCFALPNSEISFDVTQR